MSELLEWLIFEVSFEVFVIGTQVVADGAGCPLAGFVFGLVLARMHSTRSVVEPMARSSTTVGSFETCVGLTRATVAFF